MKTEQKSARDINDWGYSGEGGMRDNFNKHNGLWTEVNKLMYDDQFVVMPLVHQQGYSFMQSELYTCYKNEEVYGCFTKINNRFFGMIRGDFAPAKWELEIKKQFNIK